MAPVARLVTRSNGPSTVRRYRDVTAVLLRHGLADVVDALHLGRSVAWSTRLLPAGARIDPSLSRAARFRLTLEELGPAFVKFGQGLSVRADLLPEDAIAELTKLQEHVAPLQTGVAEAAVEAELGAPLASLFDSFDASPLASASMAQVHRATLRSGEPVAVKVRRPGIGPVIAGDIEILRHLARLVERHVPGADVLNPRGVVEEFARTIRAEQDFTREARNIERCRTNFDGDPSFKIVEHAAPLAERMWQEEYSPEAIGRRLAEGAYKTMRAAGRAPAHLDAIARKIRDGRLEIRFVHRNLDHFVQEMDRSSNRLAFALIIAALIVGSSLVIQAGRGVSLYGYPVLGLAGFVVAAMFGVRLAIGIMRSGRL